MVVVVRFKGGHKEEGEWEEAREGVVEVGGEEEERKIGHHFRRQECEVKGVTTS